MSDEIQRRLAELYDVAHKQGQAYSAETLRRACARIHELEADVEAARREREEMREEQHNAAMELDILANQKVYRGNSVSYIYDKCEVYKRQVGMAFKALRLLGFRSEECSSVDGMEVELQQWSEILRGELERRRAK